jgi:hypothetical protein
MIGPGPRSLRPPSPHRFTVRRAGYPVGMGARGPRRRALAASQATPALATTGTAPGPGPTSTACTRKVARAVIPRTRVGARFLKLIGDDAWSIVQLGCLKLLGGTQRDMVALASCCTAASPTPLFIFRPTASGWQVTYARNTPLIAEIARLGTSLIEKRPIYHRSTPLCCPAGYSYWSLAHRRGRWLLKRTAKPA